MGWVSAPHMQVPAGDSLALAGQRGRTAGPMAARATIHYFLPAALEETGRVLYLSESDRPGQPQTATLWAAGRGGPNQPELLVFYIDGDRANPRRRLYVEFRQPKSAETGPSRWDAGLSDDPREGDATGAVVHTVEETHWPDGRPAGFDRVHYRGTVPLAGSDPDVLVLPPAGGSFVVEIAPAAEAPATQPDRVEIKVGRNPVSAPRT
jgi:hypothetical protein